MSNDFNEYNFPEPSDLLKKALKGISKEEQLESDVQVLQEHVDFLEAQNKKLMEFIKNDVSTYNENYTHPDELVEKAEQIIKDITNE